MLNLFGIYKGKLKIWCRKTICLNLLHLYIWLLLFQTQTNVHYCFILVLTAVRVSILMVLTLATVLVQDMKGQIAQQVIFLLSSIILHILYQSFCLRLIHTKMFMFSLVYSYMNKYTQNTTQAIPFHQINAFYLFYFKFNISLNTNHQLFQFHNNQLPFYYRSRMILFVVNKMSFALQFSICLFV